MSYMRLCFGVLVASDDLPHADRLPNVHKWMHAMCGCGEDFGSAGELMKCMSDTEIFVPVDLWEVVGEAHMWIASPAGLSVRTSRNFQSVNLTRLIRSQEIWRMTLYYEFLESIEYDFLEILPSWFLARTEN